MVHITVQESGAVVGFGAFLPKPQSFQFNLIKESFVLERILQKPQ